MTDDAISPKRHRFMRGWSLSRAWRALKTLILAGLVCGLILAIIAFVFVVKATRDLPSVESLSEYQPPVMSRVHAGDGKLISEFRKQARVFVPISTVPKPLQHAFVAAEDKRFYTHNGFDPIGFTRAMVANVGHVVKGQRMEGGSTLTQQVAKNFLVGNERNLERKIREIAIARRIEKAMSKDEILELYLNEIYFGRGAYGVAAASLNYFGKPMKDLSVAEIAYLAVLPKGPSNYQVHDPKKKSRALFRRNYVLNRMVEDGYVPEDAAKAAKDTDIVVVRRFEGDEYLAAEYFVEEARKQIYKMYGEKELYEGGLSIRTTLDTSMQLAGRQALRRGLEMMDRRHGYRGPLVRWDSLKDWQSRLAAFPAPADIGEWRVAVVQSVSDKVAQLGFLPPTDRADDDIYTEEDVGLYEKGSLALADILWAKKALAKGAVGRNLTSVTSVVSKGDVILVQRHAPAKDGTLSTKYNLRQVPKANGGLIAMDPHTGRILALIGGYSFEQSQFNRVTQANRQPGSAFKPFVYAAALQNDFTPASQILDAPFVIERQDVDCEENELGALELRSTDISREEGPIASADKKSVDDEDCERFYKPENYNAGNFYGLSTLRLGVEKSRNAMTVRLANEIGMAPIMRIGKKFGIYDEVRPELAWALGAGETNLLRMATAYSAMINGGKAVQPRILDRVQDGRGQTVYNAFNLACTSCAQEDYLGGPPPELPDERAQIIDPITAYQMTYIMQGVVENGTGGKLRALGRPLGGKTGTTNDSLDNWFMGFSPDLVVGVYVGMDRPEQMGRETGSSSAAPIVRDFLKVVLEDQAKVPFRIPEGVVFAPINRATGEPSYIGAPGFLLEAFKPGTEPTIGNLSRTIRLGSGTDVLSFPSERALDLEVPAALSDEGDDKLADTETAPREAKLAPPEQETPEQETPEQETPEQETPEQETPEQETSELDRLELPFSETLPQVEEVPFEDVLPDDIVSDGVSPDDSLPDFESPKKAPIQAPTPPKDTPDISPVEKALDEGLY